MWFDQRFIQAFDFGWGELYRSLGLKAMMAFAGFFAWFDRWGIDGVVDNVAYGTQEFGNQSPQSPNRKYPELSGGGPAGYFCDRRNLLVFIKKRFKV